MHDADLRRHVERERDALARGALADHRDAVLEQVGQGHRREVELHPPGLDLRQVEDLVDELEEVAPGVADVADVLLLALGQLAEHAVEQHVGEPDDGVQRRPELVRHAREELGLVAAGDLELARLVLELAEQAGVVDRGGRLARQRLEQPDGLVGERARRLPADRQDADDVVAAAQRDGDDRAPAVAAQRVEVRVGGLGRELRRPGAPRRPTPPRPMNVSSRRDRDLAQRLGELGARAEAGPQRELAAVGLVLEDRPAVGLRQLDGAGDDRREHLVGVEARADGLADLAEGAQLVDRAGELGAALLQLAEQMDVLDRDRALGGERRDELDRRVVERGDLGAAERRSRRRRALRSASGRRAACGSAPSSSAACHS